MKEKISSAYEALQLLDIRPTQHNIRILAGVLDAMREIYQELEELDNGGKTNSNER